jgi:hypothetical protein
MLLMVRRLVVTSSPVVPSPRSGALHEEPVLVGECHGEAVELELARVLDHVGLEPLAAAAVEVGDVLVVEGVGEREHRHAVHDRREALGGPWPLRAAWASRATAARGLLLSSTNSRKSASYSASEISGASWTW